MFVFAVWNASPIIFIACLSLPLSNSHSLRVSLSFILSQLLCESIRSKYAHNSKLSKTVY